MTILLFCFGITGLAVNPAIHRSRGDFLWITHSVLNMMFICSQRYFWATRMIGSALLFDNAKGQV
jgi:hypothetical protein